MCVHQVIMFSWAWLEVNHAFLVVINLVEIAWLDKIHGAFQVQQRTLSI
jgi:hypothetical protein